MTRFMSNCVSAMVAAKIAVMASGPGDYVASAVWDSLNIG